MPYSFCSLISGEAVLGEPSSDIVIHSMSSLGFGPLLELDYYYYLTTFLTTTDTNTNPQDIRILFSSFLIISVATACNTWTTLISIHPVMLSFGQASKKHTRELHDEPHTFCSDEQGIMLITVSAIFLALAILAVVFRLWSLRLKKRSLAANDYLIILSLVRIQRD